MVILTESKIKDLLMQAYDAGAASVWAWQRKHGRDDPPRLQDVPKLQRAAEKAIEPLIEEARQA